MLGVKHDIFTFTAGARGVELSDLEYSQIVQLLVARQNPRTTPLKNRVT